MDVIYNLWPILLIGLGIAVSLVMNVNAGVQKIQEEKAELEERRAQRRDAQERRAAEQDDSDDDELLIPFKGDQDQDVPPPSEGASTPTQAMDAEEEARLASLDAMADEEAMKEEAGMV